VTGIAYIDESQRNGRYLLGAMVVDHRSVAAVRRALTAANPPSGVGRRHFTKEKDSERKQLVAFYRELPGTTVSVYVIDASAGPPVAQRARALHLLVPQLLELGVDRIVFDHVDHADALRDRQILVKLTRGYDVDYGHEPPHTSEPMLWVPDAAAWCAGRPGWKAELEGWVAIAFE
jgi:hypothetical protein